MKQETLNAVKAASYVVVAVSIAFFAFHKHIDDQGVAKPLQRIADKFSPLNEIPHCVDDGTYGYMACEWNRTHASRKRDR